VMAFHTALAAAFAICLFFGMLTFLRDAQLLVAIVLFAAGRVLRLRQHDGSAAAHLEHGCDQPAEEACGAAAHQRDDRAIGHAALVPALLRPLT
jgi:hypothetical protein